MGSTIHPVDQLIANQSMRDGSTSDQSISPRSARSIGSVAGTEVAALTPAAQQAQVVGADLAGSQVTVGAVPACADADPDAGTAASVGSREAIVGGRRKSFGRGGVGRANDRSMSSRLP